MERENLDINSITDERRQAIEQTLETINADKLKKVGDELFPFFDDPWREKYFQFIHEHPGSSFYHASTRDGIQFLYCHDQNRGIWFIPGTGLGPLQENGLKIFKRAVESRR